MEVSYFREDNFDVVELRNELERLIRNPNVKRIYLTPEMLHKLKAADPEFPMSLLPHEYLQALRVASPQVQNMNQLSEFGSDDVLNWLLDSSDDSAIIGSEIPIEAEAGGLQINPQLEVQSQEKPGEVPEKRVEIVQVSENSVHSSNQFLNEHNYSLLLNEPVCEQLLAVGQNGLQPTINGVEGGFTLSNKIDVTEERGIQELPNQINILDEKGSQEMPTMNVIIMEACSSNFMHIINSVNNVDEIPLNVIEHEGYTIATSSPIKSN